jgi:hypothetical protein
MNCLVVSLALLAPSTLPLCAQNQAASGTPQISRVETALGSRGFSFDAKPRAMCSINGPMGPCRVEAFVFGETGNDQAAYTCSKLDKAFYVGKCVDGTLQGLSLVVADGTAKLSKEVFMSYFDRGRMAYPALTAEDFLIGVREARSSYGCIFFGNEKIQKWDSSSTREACSKFKEIYGPDVFSERTLLSLRNGSIDLGRYNTQFINYVPVLGQAQGAEAPTPVPASQSTDLITEVAKQASAIQTEYYRKRAELNRAAALRANVQNTAGNRSSTQPTKSDQQAQDDVQADIQWSLKEMQRLIDQDPATAQAKLEQELELRIQQREQQTSQQRPAQQQQAAIRGQQAQQPSSDQGKTRVLYPELDASQCVQVEFEDGGKHAGGAFSGNHADLVNRCNVPVVVAYCSQGGDFDCGKPERFDWAGLNGFAISTESSPLKPGSKEMISSGGNSYGKGFVFFACSAENNATTAILSSINPPQGSCYIPSYAK